MPKNSRAMKGILEVARRDLLDLGLRNTLLNYRPLRGKGVEVVDEIPREIFRLLVREEKSMTFLPDESAGIGGNGHVGDAQLAQPEEDHSVASRHIDSRLQTAYSSAQLQSRLLATHHAARTSLEEQGVNTLYLALGMLSWREEENSEKFCRAPLILIPAQLERSDARDRFHLKYTGEELGGNVSLAEKLKQSFGIKNFPSLSEVDDLDVDDYFGKVQRAIRGQAGWAIETDAVVLGFFSFAKFLMYRDLDPSTWPSEDMILGHRVLEALLGEDGFQSVSSTFSEDRLLDEQLQGRDIVQVVDSDSSQTLALADSLDGHTMVIQGPPGTGKSQTIVNLIAGAVADAKRVLFVSEKVAALDVVKRRLDQAKLGAACLELHSNRTNKKTIIEELRRTASGERRANPLASAELSLLRDTRERLNEYCKAVNEPIGDSGESPCTAYGRLLRAQSSLNGLELPQFHMDTAAEWTSEDVVRRDRLVAQLQDRVAQSGIPTQHPFWGSELRVLLPTDCDEIRHACNLADSSCGHCQESAISLARALGVEAPSTDYELDRLLASVRCIFDAPALDGVKISASEWVACEPEIRQTIATGLRLHDIRRQFEAALRPEAWTTDVFSVRQCIDEVGNRWWRWLSSRWRNARKSLQSICATTTPKERESQLALLDAVLESSVCARSVANFAERFASLFGSSWKGIHSDWSLISAQANWIMGVQKGIQEGTLAAWCLDPAKLAIDKHRVGSQQLELQKARDDYRAAVSRWSVLLDVNESRFPEGPLRTQSLEGLRTRWSSQSVRINELHALVAFNQVAAECKKEDLRSIAHVAEHWEHAGTLLVALYERGRIAELLRRAFRERNSLAVFDGVRHANAVSDFRRLDLLQLEYNRALLAAKHTQSLPRGGGAGEIGVLWREFEKRARFLPIRSLIMQAGHAIQTIKPIFMMSPLSIANYLPPGALTFDLIIFDEASQVRPVEALGAIVRGQQVLVVGDSRQLPPTNFFDSLVGSDGEEEDDETTAAADIESVLGLFCSRGAHQRMLRWHYRSRHESLIAVSNHLFYDDRLVTFPSPDRSREKLGLICRHIENAYYDRGRTRTNPGEARAIAAAVMAHARKQMQLKREVWETLGVVAFSVTQMDAIVCQLELLRRQDPSCESFFSYPPHEPFFVKNLENVQGDERDVILISVGYGRTAEGYLAMSFGPLNRTGGERRLNVLISRARKRCEVFTTLGADDIDLSKTSSAGVAALKTFLHYAEKGQMDVPQRTEKLPDSEFEEQVLRQLTNLGHRVDTQVGSAGFFLDLAVVDPANPGRYLLGIECDGARYHSARSARDRDRLRQAVLEGLGWRIHRIWSTDWFKNPEQELRKVVLAIEVARETTPAAPPSVVAPRLESSQEKVAVAKANWESVPASSSIPAYEMARVAFALNGVEMHLVARTQLASLLAEVVNVESPVHWAEASRRVLWSAGIQRFGSRIHQAFEEAVKDGLARKMFKRRGDFLWSMSMQQAPVRDRREIPAASRSLEFVAPEEIQRAVESVVRESCGIVPGEVAVAVCRLLGFARVTNDMAAAVEKQRDALMRSGRLRLQGLNLVPVQD